MRFALATCLVLAACSPKLGDCRKDVDCGPGGICRHGRCRGAQDGGCYPACQAGAACAGGSCQPDRDRDGVADALDNCPDHANPEQDDADRDGLGDACDSNPNVPALTFKSRGFVVLPGRPANPGQAVRGTMSFGEPWGAPAAADNRTLRPGLKRERPR